MLDADGGAHYLKMLPTDGSRRMKDHEHLAMKHLRGTGRAPRTRKLSPDGSILLVEETGLSSLHAILPLDPELIVKVGPLARRIHALEVPDWAIGQREFLETSLGEVRAAYEHLPPDVPELAEPLFERLLAARPERRFLHGDLHERNVVVRAGRLYAIDPFGLVGDRALDVATFAGFHDRPLWAAARVLQRYGSRPRRLRRWLALNCLRAARARQVWGDDPEPALVALRTLAR